MRDLHEFELKFVSGAGNSPSGDCTCPTPSKPSKQKKGNNGFGNGADANTDAPGGSGKTGGGKEDSIGDSRGAR